MARAADPSPKTPKARALRAGDVLARPARTRGLVGVRKLAVGILQQQLEELRDRWLTPTEREFLLDACRVLVTGEKVFKAPGNGMVPRSSAADSPGSPLPPLSTKT